MGRTWRRLFLFIGTPLVVLTILALAWALTTRQPETIDEFVGGSQLPRSVVAVVDYQRVLHNAQSTRVIRERIDEMRQQVRDEIAAEENRLHERDVALGEQRGKISNEEFAAARRQFEAEVARVQRIAQDRAQALDTISSEALGEVRGAIIAVLEDIADEREFNLVLPSDTVLLFSPQIDLTEEVLRRLDERLPKVEIETALP